MYGIAGWFDEVSEPEEMSQRMAQRLRHRGPDGQLTIRPSMPKALGHALRHLLRLGNFIDPSGNPIHYKPPLKKEVLESLAVISIVRLLTFTTMGKANDAITGNCINVRLPTFTMMRL